ncbi:MAG: pyruvate synthase [Alphaproteobacteria bacterium]|jgi:pyruvate ferredoxin oxidoreductase alpha subunit|nr:pyruvate synthase [Alphaproteobacteria bacterium]
MTRTLLTGNAAAAWGARLARVDYLPAFPITPQTEIIETVAQWIANDEMRCRMVMLESEHSMLTAAGAAASTGVRTFTATSSQGLLYGMEMLYTIAGWRVPLVLINVSRGLSAPITLEPDHNDILAARDSGCLQFHCATCQEVVDAILIAYRVAEQPRVRLPVIVNLDGFSLSFTREPVSLPDMDAAARFLPAFRHDAGEFRGGRPASKAVAVIGGGAYSYFRYEAHLAAMAAIDAYGEAAGEFEQLFGRRYPSIECYRNDDAEISFVMIGSFATKAKEAVDRLRDAGHKVGLVRPFMLRPLPEADLRTALEGKSGIAVIDQNLAPGRGGVLHGEVTSVLYGPRTGPATVLSYIGGLGGRDIGAEEFFQIAADVRAAVASGTNPAPRLLYTQSELGDMRKMQAVAHREAAGEELAS